MNTTAKDREFFEKLREWWQANSRSVTAVAAGVLAPGIICVADIHKDQDGRTRKEVDIYFDLNRYRYRNPTVWEDRIASRVAAPLGYLDGLGTSEEIRTPDQAYEFAREHLVAIEGEIAWTEFQLADEFGSALLKDAQ